MATDDLYPQSFITRTDKDVEINLNDGKTLESMRNTIESISYSM